MVVFPRFEHFYQSWRKDLESKGVTVRLSTEVTEVVRRDKEGVTVKIIKRTPAEDGHNPTSAWVTESDRRGVSQREENGMNDADANEETEYYDEIVLCVL